MNLHAGMLVAGLMLPFMAQAGGLPQAVRCDTAGTQAQLDACAVARFQKADAGLNRTWKAIVARYADQPDFLEKLKAAQRLWIRFRDASVEARYPAENPRAEYGSVYPMCVAGYKAKLTRQRIEQLRQWLDGVPEGEVCAGSVKRSDLMTH